MSDHYILMIEDDADDRYITESVFLENGYNIRPEFLTKGEEVIGYLSERSYEGRLPSLIILDKNLPATDGLEILRALKEHPLFMYLPIVVVSGTAFPKDVADSYALGANSFIQKPATNKLTTERIDIFVKYWFGIVDLPRSKVPHTLTGHPQVSY